MWCCCRNGSRKTKFNLEAILLSATGSSGRHKREQYTPHYTQYISVHMDNDDEERNAPKKCVNSEWTTIHFYPLICPQWMKCMRVFRTVRLALPCRPTVGRWERGKHFAPQENGWTAPYKLESDFWCDEWQRTINLGLRTTGAIWIQREMLFEQDFPVSKGAGLCSIVYWMNCGVILLSVALFLRSRFIIRIPIV